MLNLFEWWRKPSGRRSIRDAEVNPYASPRIDPPPSLPRMPPEQWETLDIRVAFVQRSAWRRAITLAGSLDALVLYNSAGFGERVYVNDRLAARTSGFDVAGNVTPRVEFDLECRGHLVSATIDVKASLSLAIFSISKFCLTVAGKKVYDE